MLPRLDDVLQLLDSIGSQRQFLVGSSMGAWLALHAALRRPHLVQVGWRRLGWQDKIGVVGWHLVLQGQQRGLAWCSAWHVHGWRRLTMLTALRWSKWRD